MSSPPVDANFRHVDDVGLVPTGPHHHGLPAYHQHNYTHHSHSSSTPSRSFDIMSRHESVDTNSTYISVKSEPDTDESSIPLLTSQQEFAALLAGNRRDTFKRNSGTRQRSFGSARRRDRRSSSSSYRTQDTRHRFGRVRHQHHRSDRQFSVHDGSPMFFPEHRLQVEQGSNNATDHFDSLEADEVEQPEPICLCPVSIYCPTRKNNLLDCRTLVAKWKAWRDTSDEDLFTVETKVKSDQDILATRAELLGVIPALQMLPQLATNDHRALEHERSIVEEWARAIKYRMVNAELIQATGVLDELGKFCSVDQKTMRKDRKCDGKITEECEILRRKWARGDYHCDRNRGLIIRATYDQNGTLVRSFSKVDKEWEHYRKANYFGEGELVNGQKWYSRVQLMRDGVHTPRVAGISGTVNEGAYSVVMGWHNVRARNFYADIDRLETIWYMGTAPGGKNFNVGITNIKEAEMGEGEGPMEPTEFGLSDADTDTEDDSVGEDQDEQQEQQADSNHASTPTACTRMLMRSLETGRPVRVIKSFRLAEIVANKPKKAFRYDGLYRVVKKLCMRKREQIWSFKMRRLPDQGPLRKQLLRELAGTSKLPIEKRQGWQPRRARR